MPSANDLLKRIKTSSRKATKGLPKRYGSGGRKAKRRRHFERHGLPYTGRS